MQNKCVCIFVICPKEGPKIEAVVLNRFGILGLFCPKQGQALRPSAAPPTPKHGSTDPPSQPSF